MEKLFESSCKHSPFDDLVITREDGEYVFTINTYRYDEVTGKSLIINSASVVLCGPQAVKAVCAVLGDAVTYKGEIENVD